jgi:hypothetical protein
MTKATLLNFSLLFVTVLFCAGPVAAAELYYSDADGIMTREERVDFTSISFKKGLAEVRVHSPSVVCKIHALTSKEANKIQRRLAFDERATIQCFGKHATVARSGVIEIETSSFSLSRRELEKTAETKSVATGN